MTRQTVYKTLAVSGCWLTSPFAPDRIDRNAAWLGPERAAVCGIHRQPPGENCECGIWATPSWSAFTDWVRRQRTVDDDTARTVRDGLAKYAPEDIEQGIQQLERLVPQWPWRRNVLDTSMHTTTALSVSWRVRAVAQGTVDGPGGELTMPVIGRHERMAMMTVRAALYGLTEEQAWEHVATTDFPDGWYRYPSLRIERLWLCSDWADQRAGLEQRYGCPVHFVGGGETWIDSLIEPVTTTTTPSPERPANLAQVAAAANASLLANGVTPPSTRGRARA